MRDAVFTPKKIIMPFVKDDEGNKVQQIVISIKNRRDKEEELEPVSGAGTPVKYFLYFPGLQQFGRASEEGERRIRRPVLKPKVLCKERFLEGEGLGNPNNSYKKGRTSKSSSKVRCSSEQPFLPLSPPRPSKIFPSSFKIKKSSHPISSLIYPQNPSPTPQKSESKPSPLVPKPHRPIKPHYIISNSHKSKFFSSKIDKILHRYKLKTAKSILRPS